MNEEAQNLPIDPELEARIVNLVLGEASETDSEELERLVSERPELSEFKAQIESVHGLLEHLASDDLEERGHEWRLSPERRAAVLGAIDPVTSEEKTIKLAEVGATPKPSMGLSPWKLLGVAAVLFIVGLIGVTLVNTSEHSRQAAITAAESNDQQQLDMGLQDFSVSDFDGESFSNAEMPSPYYLSDDVQMNKNDSISELRAEGVAKVPEDYSAKSRSALADLRSKLESAQVPSFPDTSGSAPVESPPSEVGEGDMFFGRPSLQGAGAQYCQAASGIDETAGDQLGAEDTLALQNRRGQPDPVGESVPVASPDSSSVDGVDRYAAGSIISGYGMDVNRGIQDQPSAYDDSVPQEGRISSREETDLFVRGQQPASDIDSARPGSTLIRKGENISEEVSNEWTFGGYGGRVLQDERIAGPRSDESRRRGRVSKSVVAGRAGQSRATSPAAQETTSTIELPEAITVEPEGEIAVADGGTVLRGGEQANNSLTRLPRGNWQDSSLDSDRRLEAEQKAEILEDKAEHARKRHFGQLGIQAEGEFRKETAVRDFVPPDGLGEKIAEEESFSTFSLHVSDVSFKLAQTVLAQGKWPQAERIRIEEFVNAFDYGDPMPRKSEKVACHMEQASHPFLQQRNVLRIALRTAAEGRSDSTPLRLTLLLDNSGSMERADRRQTVLRAFDLLTQQLTPADQVTLITFSRQPRLLADKVSGAQSQQLMQQVRHLPSEGGTNFEAALDLAWEKAKEQQMENAQNRVILLTDGAANLGDADPTSLAQRIVAMRKAGFAFDAAGISADGLNDEILGALTRNGDGRYYLLDRPEDADEGFAQQIAGALRPAAKNVKVQVEFNPERVGRYKLLGFDKHRLQKEDFRNDKVDAAEMAAAEAGVAVYQFEAKPEGQGDVGSVSVRFRDMSSGEMVERRWPIPYEPSAVRLDQAAASVRIATTAALLAAKLRGEPLGGNVNLKTLSTLIDGLPEVDRSSKRVQQLQQMIQQTRRLSGE